MYKTVSETPASDAPPKHIVAVSGLVTNPSDNTVLLIQSPRRGWEFPGGQVEQGENLIAALKREVREETGVLVSVGELVGVYSNTASHIVMFGFLCEYESGELCTSLESLAVEWVSRDEARARVMRPPLRDRLRDMLDFNGTVIYRAYEFDAQSQGDTIYRIGEERLI